MRQTMKLSGAVSDLLLAVNTARSVYAMSFPMSVDMGNDIGRAIIADNYGDKEATQAQIVFTPHQRCNITHLPTTKLYVLHWEPPAKEDQVTVSLIYSGPLRPVWDLGYPLANSPNKRVVRMWKIEAL